MVALFDTDALFATVNHRLLDPTANCIILDSEGSLVASARDRVGAARWTARALTILGRSSRFEWDVLDPAGNRVLDVTKPSSGMRGPSPTVALADGRLLGRAVSQRRLAGLPRVSLLSNGGTVLGELVPALGERRSHPILFYRIHTADGEQIGEISRQTRDGWGFHLLIDPGASIQLRALSIAYVLCLIQEQTTGSSF